jgi:hypothetical protein
MEPAIEYQCFLHSDKPTFTTTNPKEAYAYYKEHAGTRVYKKYLSSKSNGAKGEFVRWL